MKIPNKSPLPTGMSFVTHFNRFAFAPAAGLYVGWENSSVGENSS